MPEKRHIVLAEDEAETRKTFAMILRKAGYEVTDVANGREALRAIMACRKDGGKVDLLITDIYMDELDGLQLLDQLDKLQINLPALAITGYGDKEIVVELMRRGCSDYIEKPFEAMELIQTVARMIKRLDRPGPAGNA